MVAEVPQRIADTSLNSSGLTGSSTNEISLLRAAITRAAMATQAMLTGSTEPVASLSGTAVPGYEFNERQAQVRELYLKLLQDFASLARFELQPGDRREVLGFLDDESLKSKEVFLDAFERIFYTESKKISDRAKSSALRFCADFCYPSDKARWVSFLINRLNSESPSQASAAAVGLSDVADEFSAPALKAAKSLVRWPSVRADLEETISEISSR